MLDQVQSMNLKRPFKKANYYITKFFLDSDYSKLVLRCLLLFACVCIGTLVEYCVLHVLMGSKHPIIFTFVYFFLAFFSSPIQAGFSDRDSRKYF